MKCCTLQAHNRNTSIFYELLDIKFAVIFLFISQGRKCPNTENVKVFSKNWSRIFHVFHSGTTHDGLVFKFKSPTLLTNVKNNGFHPEVCCGNLGTKARTHAWI